MPHHTESKCQQALIRWFSFAHRGLGVPDARLLFAVPNGGARNVVTGSILKAEGVRAGMPDLLLAMPSTTHARLRPRHGLFIELKTWCGRVSPVQRQMLQLLRDAGYEAVVAHGFDQAQRAITQYMQGKEVDLS